MGAPGSSAGSNREAPCLKGPDDWKSNQSPNVDEEICGVLSWQGQLEVNQTLREPGIVMVIGIKRGVWCIRVLSWLAWHVRL